LYAWAIDRAGNISSLQSATVIIDLTPPVVTEFTMPGTNSSLTVNFTTLTATDLNDIASYMITETSTAPAASTSGWSADKPTSYTFNSPGNKTLYAWAKDPAGNVSTTIMSATVKIPYKLTISFRGSGGGSVASLSPTFSCNGICTQSIFGGTVLTITAVKAQYSIYGGWTGCDTVIDNDCQLTMDRDREAAVTFNFDSDHVTKIKDTNNYFQSLQEAYNSPLSSRNTILVWGVNLPEAINCGVDKQVTISGGYDQQYQTPPNITTVRGLTVSRGTVTIDGIVVK
jgi:hypothetical protein